MDRKSTVVDLLRLKKSTNNLALNYRGKLVLPLILFAIFVKDIHILNIQFSVYLPSLIIKSKISVKTLSRKNNTNPLCFESCNQKQLIILL